MNQRYVILGPYTRDEFHKWFRDSNKVGRVLQVIPIPNPAKGGERWYEVLVELAPRVLGRYMNGHRDGSLKYTGSGNAKSFL